VEEPPKSLLAAIFFDMSNYGQQPPAYGQNPYGQQANPYAQPGRPYSQPGQPPSGQPAAAGQPYVQPAYGAQASPYTQPNPSGQAAPPYGPPYGPGSAWTPQSATHTRQPIARRAIPVVTMDAVPGREIASLVGDVVGVVARFRELPPELRGDHPIDGYVAMLTRSRQEAVTRLVEMAVAAGADAVVGLRHDCSEITQTLSEVAAYGTAVRLVPASGQAAPPARHSAGNLEDIGHDDDDDVTAATEPTSRPGATAAPTSTAAEAGGADAGSGQAWPSVNWPSRS
jgi:uncharacterized protein YbjQ (UPF0145 family)